MHFQLIRSFLEHDGCKSADIRVSLKPKKQRTAESWSTKRPAGGGSNVSRLLSCWKGHFNVSYLSPLHAKPHRAQLPTITYQKKFFTIFWFVASRVLFRWVYVIDKACSLNTGQLHLPISCLGGSNSCAALTWRSYETGLNVGCVRHTCYLVSVFFYDFIHLFSIPRSELCQFRCFCLLYLQNLTIGCHIPTWETSNEFDPNHSYSHIVSALFLSRHLLNADPRGHGWKQGRGGRKVGRPSCLSNVKAANLTSTGVFKFKSVCVRHTQTDSSL